jgi:hypothetical protein
VARQLRPFTPWTIRKRHFQSPRTNEASDAEDQLRAAALEILQVHLVQAPHHSAFARQHRWHVNRRTRLGDSAAFRSAKVRRDLRAVDGVLARNARDVRARSADEFSLDDGGTLSVAGKRPRSERRSRPVPEDDQIVLFRLRLLKYLSGSGVFGVLHADFPFRATGSLLVCIDFTRAADDAPSSDSP